MPVIKILPHAEYCPDGASITAAPGTSICEALLDQTCRYWVDWMTGFLAEVGDLLDIIMIGDDLAGQDGPLFSPSFYRSVVQPRQRRVIDTIRKNTGAKIWYHTCGSCVSLIPDLLDNGIDILNPVQISARHMDPAELKKRFGNRLVFWADGSGVLRFPIRKLIPRFRR